ncbi:hypothetical protein [Massilia sp.]|uniref:hypothetical protein n=1 Tax=Massilia sp. TaxID=1882437 RepID=UPI00289D4BBA|nr:hypothetical protein [Massilia sp.]
MKRAVTLKDFLILIGVVIVWTVVVMALSTSMGTRPLRIYDWGPPVFAAALTLLFMLKDRMSGPDER